MEEGRERGEGRAGGEGSEGTKGKGRRKGREGRGKGRIYPRMKQMLATTLADCL